MLGSPFALPYDLRLLAGRNIDQARMACTQLMDATEQAMRIWVDALPSNEATSRFKAVQHRAISFGKQNLEAALALANELANAESFEGLLAKQSRYVQAQVRNYDLQAQELGRLVIGNPQSLQLAA